MKYYTDIFSVSTTQETSWELEKYFQPKQHQDNCINSSDNLSKKLWEWIEENTNFSLISVSNVIYIYMYVWTILSSIWNACITAQCQPGIQQWHTCILETALIKSVSYRKYAYLWHGITVQKAKNNVNEQHTQTISTCRKRHSVDADYYQQ